MIGGAALQDIKCPIYTLVTTQLFNSVFVMTGQRRVNPCAVRCLIDRIKQAKVSGQKQEYQRQGRDVNNTRQKSGSQTQVQSSKVGQSGVKHRDNK